MRDTSVISARTPAPAVDLAARILILLSRYERSQSTLTQIARRLDASPATCLRVLRTLATHRMVECDAASKRYSLGPTMAALGSRAAESVDSLSRVRPVMARLAEEAGMTAAFVQRTSHDRLMYTQKAAPSSSPHSGVEVSVGNRFPLTDVSYGAWWAAQEEDNAHAAALIPTPRVDTGSPEAVLTLAQIRALDHDSIVESRSLYVPGIWAASAPVFAVTGHLDGVLVLLTPSEDLAQDRRTTARSALTTATASLNSALAHHDEQRL